MIDDVLCISECGSQSVQVNSYINSKFELKNLRLNHDKCHQIHVGEQNLKCPPLKAHQNEVLKVSQDKYLGDIISSDGKNNTNIDAKAAVGMGAISNIMNIMREISLGDHYFSIGILLRQTIFLSVILSNSETWVNLTKDNIEDLEKIDRILLKRIFEAPSSTSTKSLYLESGCIPIKFMIQAKRIMFLHYLLKREDDELISQVLYAQKEQPIKNDWFSTVMEDLKDFGLEHLEVEDIKNMSKDHFKKLVKENCKDIALNYL